MRNIFGIIFVAGIMAFGSMTATAQCNPDVEGAIKCGYYTEGYQDGVNDARSNQSNDYRRYRNKFENKYESYYRVAYEAGFASVRPTVRWTYSQRSAYDSGYTIGQNDRRSGGQGRAAENSVGGYDATIGQYFQQGYFDGFNNRPRQYDVPITPNPGWPGSGGGGGGGTSNGSATWSGRVDGRANIYLTGGSIRAEDMTGTGLQIMSQNMNGSIPRRPTTVTVNRREGRGSVTVIQQPNRSNNFTAIVQIDDSRGGAGDYRLEMNWTSAGYVEEPYSTGTVRWRGRVDQTATISINGSDVQTQDTSGTGISGVSFDINGYLAHRPGSVNVRRRSGRGTVTVVQQPNRSNDYTAVIQIFDAGSGADNYEVEITW